MNILIVEDTRLLRSKLVDLLDGTDDYRVVAAVESAEEALVCLAAHRVQLVILDLGLPGISDGPAVSALSGACPEAAILVYTAAADDARVYAALKAGAVGYLLKSARPAQIIAAVEEIRAGGAPMSPAIALKLLQEFQRQPESAPQQAPASPLSGRETEIMALLYQGDNLGQMAAQLGISLHTVREHIKKIYAKLMVSSRSQAIYEALQLNLIKR
jgi:DNA-binding NarL/FixJ family response regulator